jgi:hypothetical protein
MKKTFHGGCLRCNSQELFGVSRCKGCQFFKADWKLPDLSIIEKIERELSRNFRRIILE